MGAWKLSPATYARRMSVSHTYGGLLLLSQFFLAMTNKKNEMVVVNNSSDTMLIDARTLHQQLQISTRFDTWIQRRIDEFGFEENSDFFELRSNLSKILRGRKPTDYHLTMDMAKELAMLERNEVGKRIRQYFIAVEKEARAAYATGRFIPKRIHSKQINGRKVYPYHHLAMELGITPSGGYYQRVKRYPNHFIKFDGLTYVSEEMANLIVMNRSVYRHRATIKNMQPLLPLDFGAPIEKLGGRK